MRKFIDSVDHGPCPLAPQGMWRGASMLLTILSLICCAYPADLDEGCVMEVEWDWPKDGSSSVLDGGLHGHWSQGMNVHVLNNGATSVEAILYAQCPGDELPGGSITVHRSALRAYGENPHADAAARDEPVWRESKMTFGELPAQRAARTEDDSTEPMSVDMTVKISLDPQDMHEIFNLTLHIGMPWGRSFTSLIASLPQFERPELVVSFPPDGYEFGTITNPFVMCHVQDLSSTESDPHMRSPAVHFLVRSDRLSDGKVHTTAQGISMMHISLGPHPEGDYRITIQPVDALLRPFMESKVIGIRVSGGGSTGKPNAGGSGCEPQQQCGQREVLHDAKNLSSLVGHCPSLGPLRGDCDCSGHGECVLGACACRPDWIGSGCTHHTLSMTRFTPEVHPWERKDRCHQAAFWGRGSSEVDSRMDELQYPTECGRLLQRRFNKTQGLGATLHWNAMSLSISLSTGKTLVVGGRWMHFDYAGCKEKGVWCVLSRITNCSITSWDWEEIKEQDFDMPEDIRVPFPQVSQDQLLWTSYLMRSTLRPSAQLGSKIRAAKNYMSWPLGGIVGLHIRHGDSCGDVSRPSCIPAEKYFSEAEAMAARYGIPTIFLATDDQSAVQASKARPGFRYMSISVDRDRLFGSKMFIEHRVAWGVVDRQAVSEATFIDLFLLSECHAFVGSFFSHFSRAAYELMVGRTGDFPPYISVDRPWKPLRPIVPFVGPDGSS